MSSSSARLGKGQGGNGVRAMSDASVRVTFRANWQTRRAQYSVAIDDVELAWRPVGEAMTFTLSPGVHMICVVTWRGSSRERSPDLAFHALSGQQLTFACRMSRMRTTYGVRIEASVPTRAN